MQDRNEKSVDILGILKKLGYTDILPQSWYSAIDAWREWYKGKTDFHKYNVYNGVKQIGCERRTLGMAKKVSEDKADLLLNEKVTITAGSESEQKIIDTVLKQNNFWVKGNQLVEIANALGTGAFVEHLEGGAPVIDYVEAPSIFPLSWQNGIVTECAFGSIRNAGKDGAQIYLNLHVLEGGLYVVYNHLYDMRGKEIPLPEDVQEKWDTKSANPLFQIITPNIVNNKMSNCPMGVSIYANGIDVLETIDLIFDSFFNEFKLGKKRIFVNDKMAKYGGIEGTPLVPVFDSNDTVFYAMPGEDDEGKKPITESNMTLRVNEHLEALQSALDLLSDLAGFGKGYYKFETDNVQTATAVISQNSKLYRKVRKDEIVLEKVLADMARAILFLSGIANPKAPGVASDDSIIEDTDAIAKRALLELQAGAIDEVEYRMITRKIDKDAAEKQVADMRKRSPAPVNMDFFTNGPEESA